MNKEYNSIVIKPEDLVKLKEGINELAEAVLVTMGPNGRTVIIPDENAKPKITKDGVSVANSIWFEDPVKQTGATLIKEVAANTLKEAGDGTSTAICLANAFINRGHELLQKGKKYAVLKGELEALETEVLSYLLNHAKDLEDGDLKKVATIAANNDEEIGELITRAFAVSDTIKIELSHADHDDIDEVDGMELSTGLFDPAFITNARRQSIEYDKAKLIVINGHCINVDVIDMVNKKYPLDPIIIIADEFSHQVIRILKDNFNRGALNIGLIKSPGYATHRANLLADICKATNAQPVPNNPNIFVGDIDGISATKDRVVLKYEGSLNLIRYVDELKESLLTDTTSDEHQLALMQQRVDGLASNVVNIRVGGKSELEAKERYDRVEDAVLATKCAIAEGVVEGGGHTLKACSKYIAQDNLFSDCLKEPFNVIYGKSFWKGPFQEDIFDPLRVVVTAFTNAISVTKTILGTEAIILNKWR